MSAVSETVFERVAVREALAEKIRRFDVHQIIQHAALMTSFVLLVVTGLPLKFATAAISEWFVATVGGIEVTRSVHHFAAYIMVAVCFYHLGYLVYTIGVLKRPFPVKMIPSPLDFKTFFHEMSYFVGLTKEETKFDRFNWREKFDYWAIFWGMPVMVLSGFIMMFPVFATSYLPGWIVPAALVAHSDEAMLALTWIAMVHIFFNHFAPGVFPMNTSIFTGKVPRERYARDHALEYESMVAGPDTAEIPLPAMETELSGGEEVPAAGGSDIKTEEGTDKQ